MSNVVPKGWEYSEMQTLVKEYKGSIVDGPFGSNLKTSDYVESGVPVLQGKNVTNDRFLWSDVRYITKDKAQELSRSSVRVGDILMVKIGSVGYSAIVDNLNNFDFAIIPANLLKIDLDESKAITKYVHHYMTSPEGKRRIVDEASSTAQPALSLGTMKKFRLPIPPLPEQKKIATILTSVDEVIENTQKQIDKLQDLKKATMNELLTKGIGHTDFKDSELGRIPIGWEIAKLGDLVNPKRPITYGIVQAGKHVEGGVPYIRVSDMKGSSLSPEGMLRTAPEIAQKFGRSAVREGDIVYALRGDVGKVLIVPKVLEGANLTQGTALISSSDRIKVSFLFWCLNSQLIRGQATDLAKGSTFTEMTLGNLKELKTVVPEKAEQERISAVLASQARLIKCSSEKLAQIKALKKSLMQDLLTGEVRVSVD